MTTSDHNSQNILARIDQLLKEADALPRSPESWERRLYIDWELFQLFRRMTAAEDTPESLDEHPRRPRRHDRPARFPS